MIETRVEIPDALASAAYKRAMSTKTMVYISSYYGRQLAVVWIVISIADATLGAEELIPYHLLVLVGVWIVASARQYKAWSREVDAMSGWSFDARLDELGVVTRYIADHGEERHDWDFYKNYVEFDSYLQIEDEHGEFSFLPKTPELFHVIEFTKRKIPSK